MRWTIALEECDIASKGLHCRRDGGKLCFDTPGTRAQALRKLDVQVRRASVLQWPATGGDALHFCNGVGVPVGKRIHVFIHILVHGGV